MKDRSDDPSHHERTPLPRSYISLPVKDGIVIYRVKLDLPHIYIGGGSDGNDGANDSDDYFDYNDDGDDDNKVC